MIKDNILEIPSESNYCVLGLLNYIKDLIPCEKIFGYSELFTYDYINLNRFNDLVSTLYDLMEKSTSTRPLIIRWHGSKEFRLNAQKEEIERLEKLLPMLEGDELHKLKEKILLAKNYSTFNNIFCEIIEIFQDQGFIIELI